MVKKVTIPNTLEPFLSRPKENLHLADISRELGKPHPTVRQWLNHLEQKGVLTKQKKGRLTLYSLNFEKRNLLDYIVIAEKNKLIRECENNPLMKELNNFLQSSLEENSKALIFGSASDSVRSANDIDLLIIGKANEKDINGFSKKINKQIHLINIKDLKAVSNALKAEIIKKHLIIKGSEDIIQWLLW